jgi:hypothetical protein
MVVEERRFKAARKAAKQARRLASAEQQAVVVQLQAFVRMRKSNALHARWLEVASGLAARARYEAEATAERLAVEAAETAAAERAGLRCLLRWSALPAAELEERVEYAPARLSAVAAVLLTAAVVTDGRTALRVRGGEPVGTASSGQEDESLFENSPSPHTTDNAIRSPAAAVRARRATRTQPDYASGIDFELQEADHDEGESGSASDCESEGSDTSRSEDGGRLGARAAGSNGKALVTGASLARQACKYAQPAGDTAHTRVDARREG